MVNTRDGSLTPNVDVMMAGARITAISPARLDSDGPQAGVRASGLFVVPGYLEMHSHALLPGGHPGALPLMLACGITGFRQMGGSDELLAERRAGRLELPPDSPGLLATPGEVLTPANAGTSEMAIATVRHQKDAGADFIKVGVAAPDVFFDAQAEARRLGIPIVGHLPRGIDVVAASAGGMKSIEHLGPGVGILAFCSTETDEILASLADTPNSRAAMPRLSPEMASLLRKMLVNPTLMNGPIEFAALKRAVTTFSEDRARRLAEYFVQDETWQCTTLIRERTCQLGDAAEFREDPNHQYVSTSTLELWNELSRQFEAQPADVKDTYRRAYDRHLQLTRLFDAAGVRIIAGSDASGAGWEVPGFALHAEFVELSRAGLSPLRVLQTTTLDAAEFLGMHDALGSVEVGKAADLVLLGSNPIESAANLHDIRGVVRAGRYYSPAELHDIKHTVATQRSAE